MDIFDNSIAVGRFGRAHGLKGFVTVHSYTEPRDNILNYTAWFAQIDKKWQKLTLLDTQITVKSVLVHVDGYGARETVTLLTNKEIRIDKSELAALETGTFYWHELIGMRVYNKDDVFLGVIKEIMATGANDVLIVEGERQRLIPYLRDKVILEIDETEKKMTVDWDMDF